MRLDVIAVICAAAVVAGLGLYWIGTRSGESDRLREQISTGERMRNANPDFSACGWFDQLRGTCK
ncbi:MAG: hypothetical protein ACU0FT_04260 [Paracoccus sp. (in: a-proteobacteria)]|uniref:hypothetical protein n=1 Tax=Paracoccus sp. TaxID=267 RepID=UPI004059A7D5